MSKQPRHLRADYVEADLRVIVSDLSDHAAVSVCVSDETGEQPLTEMRFTYAQFRALAAAITAAQSNPRLA